MDPHRFLPLKPHDLHILLVLAEADMHGYGIMKAVEAQTDGRVGLEVGSLYRLLGRLLDDGLLAPAPQPADEPDERRKYYRLTELGRAVARAETERLDALLAAVRSGRLLEDRA
jgi:DNA-binding PadR family transcriptional regulator